MSSIRQPFFALLRAGLWGNTVDASLFSKSTDWNSILTLATQQTVPAILSEGINHLPEEYRPDETIMRHLHSLTVHNIRNHALMNRTLAHIVTLLRNNGIHPLLLKGQGVASNYLKPTLRWCGDIDLYIGKEDYANACLLTKQWSNNNECTSESRKHFLFIHNGVIVEFHRIAEHLPIPWQNTRFQQWTREHLHESEKALREIELEGVSISLPPVNFDVLYIFNHAWYHFSVGYGIGLRQLCDWVRYLHTFCNEIDRDELERNLHAFGLWRSWLFFGYIAVDMLGLPAEEYPFYTNRYATQGEKILEMIESGGNFGQFNPSRPKHPEGYIKGKLHSFKERQKRLCKLFPLFPKQIAGVWIAFLYDSFRRLYREKTGRATPSYIKTLSINK